MSDAEISKLWADAQRARAQGRAEVAQACLEAVLSRAPEHTGALNMLGALALGRDDPEAAAMLFERAAAADPNAPPLWINLAKARRLLGDAAAERAALARLLELDRRHLVGLIRIAELEERLGDTRAAAAHWAGVLAVAAQLDPRPPELATVLAHASAVVAAQTSDFADRVDRQLAESLAVAEERDRRRLTACVDHMLGRRPIYTNQCAGLHYPFLPADEFFDRAFFPWMAELEASTDTVRQELEALIAAGQPGFAPYVAMEKGLPRNKWTELDNSRDWSALHLWREGARVDAACALCPETAAILERLPLAVIPGRGPTVFFSILQPRTKIPPHTGVSNVRTIVHLPLIVPPGCGFRVGGETREWQVGTALAFDDTIEHEAWNDSDELRAVLIFDVWNPHLSSTERNLLQQLFSLEGTGDDGASAIKVSG